MGVNKMVNDQTDTGYCKEILFSLVICLAVYLFENTLLISPYFLFQFVKNGVTVNEMSPAEMAVTMRFPYCLMSNPLKSRSAIIVNVSIVKIPQ